MDESNDRFERDEIIFKGSWPFFPLGKIAKILDVNEAALSRFCGKTPEILNFALIVTDISKKDTQLYLNPISCHLLISLSPATICGKRLKTAAITVMKGITDKKTSFVKRVLKFSPPFIKAIYQWSDLGERETQPPYNPFELFEGNEPVQ